MDTESPRYREAGLAYLSMEDDQAFEKLLADPVVVICEKANEVVVGSH